MAGTLKSTSSFRRGCLLLILFVLFLKWPDYAVIFSAFIIYTNAAVVMSKFHGVPQVVGYAVPLLLLIPLIRHLFVHKRKIKINFVFILMLLYLSVILVGSVFSRDIHLALPNVINYVVEGLALYFLLINTIRTPKLLKQIVWSLLIAGALMGGCHCFNSLREHLITIMEDFPRRPARDLLRVKLSWDK